MPSGWTTLTKNHFKLDAAVLLIDAVKYLTRGGVAVTFDETIRNPEFDGKTADIAAADRITMRNARMTTVALEFELVKMMTFLPGSTSAAAGGVTTITPADAGVPITAMRLVKAEGKRSDGKLIRVVFPKALVRMTGIEATHGTEGGMALEILARLDMDAGGATTDVAPHAFEIVD